METIIVFRMGSLGDTIVALPCFHRVACSYPDARRVLVTNTPASEKAAPVEAVLGNSGFIDEVIYFPPPPRKFRDFIQLRNEILATGSRTLVYVANRDLLPTLRDVCFFYLCGIRRFIGAPFTRALRQPQVDPATELHERESERLARCLSHLGPINLEDQAMWDLRLQPEEVRSADRALAPLNGCNFIALNTGGKVEAKDWGDENWLRLLPLMSPDFSDCALVFFGSDDEFHRSQRLGSLWSGRLLNLCGRLAPRESAAAMARAAFFVGHDSGPMHLAAAMGINCVSIFGDYNRPRRWHPYGAGHRIIHDLAGVRAISPERVYIAIQSIAAQQDIQFTQSGMAPNSDW